jgi:hypothetical protein
MLMDETSAELKESVADQALAGPAGRHLGCKLSRYSVVLPATRVIRASGMPRLAGPLSL